MMMLQPIEQRKFSRFRFSIAMGKPSFFMETGIGKGHVYDLSYRGCATEGLLPIQNPADGRNSHDPIGHPAQVWCGIHPNGTS